MTLGIPKYQTGRWRDHSQEFQFEQIAQMGERAAEGAARECLAGVETTNLSKQFVRLWITISDAFPVTFVFFPSHDISWCQLVRWRWRSQIPRC